MHSVIVGAGPTGLYTAIALARRGHQVTVIDRDPGPAAGQWWDRKGVMQFHHPHFFRQQVTDALVAEMPEVWQALLMGELSSQSVAYAINGIDIKQYPAQAYAEMEQRRHAKRPVTSDYVGDRCCYVE